MKMNTGTTSLLGLTNIYYLEGSTGIGRLGIGTTYPWAPQKTAITDIAWHRDVNNIGTQMMQREIFHEKFAINMDFQKNISKQPVKQ